MEVELTVELGADDPTLAVPWSDPEGRFSYFDLRRDPSAIDRMEEALTFPGLRDFLNVVNSPVSNLQSAKCDAWFSDEITEEELIFGAQCKFGSYVDLTFHQPGPQTSFPLHEAFGQRWVELLKRAPEMPASAEIIIRRAHYEEDSGEVREGFYFTLYVFGFGDDEEETRKTWEIALRLAGHAVLQLSAGRGR